MHCQSSSLISPEGKTIGGAVAAAAPDGVVNGIHSLSAMPASTVDGGGGGTYTVGPTVVAASVETNAASCAGFGPGSAPNCSKSKSIPSVGTSVIPKMAHPRQRRTIPVYSKKASRAYCQTAAIGAQSLPSTTSILTTNRNGLIIHMAEK